MTRLNAALNEVEVDVRDGSFFEPVAGERFDLIATNPPFVISPATGERLVYRDSGLPGDRVVEHIVRTGPDHLTDGGWLQVLANWAIVDGRPWDERLGVVAARRLRRAASCSARCSTRRRTSSCGSRTRPPRASRLRPALRHLAVVVRGEGIEGVGFGWINVPAGRRGRPPATSSSGRTTSSSPSARRSTSGARRRRRCAGSPTTSCSRSALRAREDVQQETVGRPGAEDPEAIVLRQQRGFRRARKADTVEAALVGASDGDLTLGQILGAIAALLQRDEADLHATYLPVVRELVGEGFLVLD